MSLLPRPANARVAAAGLVYGVLAGAMATLLVGVVEPATGTGIDRGAWVLLMVAASTTVFLWKQPDGYAAVVSGSYILASTMVLVWAAFVVFGPAASGNRLRSLASPLRAHLLLLAAAGTAALGRRVARKRDEGADRPTR